MKRFTLAVIAVLCIVSMIALASDNPAVPKYIRLTHYNIKPGKDAEFGNLVQQVRATLQSANADYHWISGEPITGAGGRVGIVGFYDSFAQMDAATKTFMTSAGALMQKTEFTRDVGDSLQGTQSVIMKFDPELSMNVEKTDLPHATYWAVTTIHTKIGAGDDYEMVRKERLALARKAGVDYTVLAYHSIAGAPAGTYYLIRPLTALADLDKDYSEAMKAVYTDSIKRDLNDLTRKSIDSVDSVIVRMAPELSRAPEVMTAANPDFWTVKEPETMMAKAPAKKSRKAAAEPVAQKSKK
jgi:hypothetical protein